MGHLSRARSCKVAQNCTKLNKLKFRKIPVSEKSPISCRKEELPNQLYYATKIVKEIRFYFAVSSNFWITMLYFSQFPAPTSSPLPRKGPCTSSFVRQVHFQNIQSKSKFYRVISILRLKNPETWNTRPVWLGSNGWNWCKRRYLGSIKGV